MTKSLKKTKNCNANSIKCIALVLYFWVFSYLTLMSSRVCETKQYHLGLYKYLPVTDTGIRVSENPTRGFVGYPSLPASEVGTIYYEYVNS